MIMIIIIQNNGGKGCWLNIINTNYIVMLWGWLFILWVGCLFVLVVISTVVVISVNM